MKLATALSMVITTSVLFVDISSAASLETRRLARVTVKECLASRRQLLCCNHGWGNHHDDCRRFDIVSEGSDGYCRNKAFQDNRYNHGPYCCTWSHRMKHSPDWGCQRIHGNPVDNANELLNEKQRIREKKVPEPWECLKGDATLWNSRVLREAEDAADAEMLGRADWIEGDRVNGTPQG